MTTRAERRGRNESLFREVNERIKQVNVAITSGEATDFLCECGDESCTQPISLSLREYEAVRAEPTHFAVVPGHVMTDIEHVIAGNERYEVVAKAELDAVKVAVAEDPRT